MTDGNYKLIIEIIDKAGNETTSVMPIYIGKVASGDLDGDGKITMIDVAVEFQIAGGNITATASQLQAGDMDGDGDIDMIDVAVLFNKLNK